MSTKNHEPKVTVVVAAYPGAMVGDVIVVCDQINCTWQENLGNMPRTCDVHIAGTRHRLDMGEWG
jgi:hypothetical protein